MGLDVLCELSHESTAREGAGHEHIMATSYRVSNDDDKIIEWAGIFAIAHVQGKFRVYEDGSHYSSTSGGVGKRGRVVRDETGKPLTFATQAEAEAWGWSETAERRKALKARELTNALKRRDKGEHLSIYETKIVAEHDAQNETVG